MEENFSGASTESRRSGHFDAIHPEPTNTHGILRKVRELFTGHDSGKSTEGLRRKEWEHRKMFEEEDAHKKRMEELERGLENQIALTERRVLYDDQTILNGERKLQKVTDRKKKEEIQRIKEDEEHEKRLEDIRRQIKEERKTDRERNERIKQNEERKQLYQQEKEKQRGIEQEKDREEREREMKKEQKRAEILRRVRERDEEKRKAEFLERQKELKDQRKREEEFRREKREEEGILRKQKEEELARFLSEIQEKNERQNRKIDEQRQKLREVEKDKMREFESKTAEQMRHLHEESLRAAHMRGQAAAAAIQGAVKRNYELGMRDAMAFIQEKMENSMTKRNGLVAIHDESEDSILTASEIESIFKRGDFIVPPAISLHERMPPIPPQCGLKWLVIYIVTKEELSSRRAIDKASRYVKEPVFRSCSKLLILQCPERQRSSMEDLLADIEGTVIATTDPAYHTEVARTFSIKSSFNEIADCLIWDARVKPGWFVKE